MTVTRYSLVALSGLFLLGAVISYVVLFDGVETTTTVLAGVAAGCAFAAYAILLMERTKR
jgi:ABC-type uncharacterized transport system permease subunit